MDKDQNQRPEADQKVGNVVGREREQRQDLETGRLTKPPKTGVLAELTRPIIGAAIEVHRELGPGLMESAYEECLCRELTLRGIAFRRQVPVPLNYKGVYVDCAYRVDLIISDVVVELKAVESINLIHEVQLVSYLRLLKKPVGLLINFHAPVLKDGIRRKIFNP